MNCELGQAGTEGLVSVVTGRKEERKESELPCPGTRMAVFLVVVLVRRRRKKK